MNFLANPVVLASALTETEPWPGAWQVVSA